MSRICIFCAIFLLASQLTSAVILRPKWYPYFQRENQASPSGSSSSQSALASSDTITSRQARSQEEEMSPLCQDGLINEDCLSKIVLVVSKILQLNNQRFPLY